MSDAKMKLSEGLQELCDIGMAPGPGSVEDARALEERVAEYRASELEGWALARDNAHRAEAAEAEVARLLAILDGTDG